MSTEKPARVFTFDRVSATAIPEGYTIIEWRVNARFVVEGPVGFFVEVSKTGCGEWTRLTATPLYDVCAYVDTNKYSCGVGTATYYRVIAYDGVCEYASRPIHTMGDHSRQDLLLAREIMRKELLRMRKFSGTLGYLLKRREYGERCPVCRDFDLGEVISGSLCTTCYGTGYVKGYFNALPMYMDFMGPTSARDVKEPFGVEDTVSVVARCLAYPRLDTYDIWVHGSANRRLVVRQTQVIAEVRAVPVLYSIQLRELPTTDIAFSAPMQHAAVSSESSSSGSSETCTAAPDQGWRRGIAYQETW